MRERCILYQGYRIVQPTDTELSAFYTKPDFNLFECKENEYLIFKDENENVIDKYHWTGEEYQQVRYVPIESSYAGKVRPRNPQQCLAFNMLQDNKTTIKLLTGVFGSGRLLAA